jgi:hypothetical protein
MRNVIEQPRATEEDTRAAGVVARSGPTPKPKPLSTGCLTAGSTSTTQHSSRVAAHGSRRSRAGRHRFEGAHADRAPELP